MDQIHDPLLARSGCVELPSHFDEPAINLLEPAVNPLEPTIHVVTQIDEVLTESVETRRGGASEVADLGSDLGDVAVGRTGEHPGCGGIPFGCLKPPPDLVEIICTHGEKTTAGAAAEVAPEARCLWTKRSDVRACS